MAFLPEAAIEQALLTQLVGLGYAMKLKTILALMLALLRLKAILTLYL